MLGIVIILWMIKFFFGFIIDGVLILGYWWGFYIIFFGILGVFFWVVLVIWVDILLKVIVAIVMSFLLVVMSDVIIDFFVVERV